MLRYRIVGNSESSLRARLVTGRLVKIATCTVISPLCFYYPQHETVFATDPEYGFAFSQLLCYFPLPRMTAWDDETSSSPEPTGGQSSVRSHLPFSLDLSVAQITRIVCSPTPSGLSPSTSSGTASNHPTNSRFSPSSSAGPWMLVSEYPDHTHSHNIFHLMFLQTYTCT